MNIFSLKRWNWMMQCIQDAFALTNKNTSVIDELKQKYTDQIKEFLDGKGSPKLIIYNQASENIPGEERDLQEPQLFVTLGDTEPLKCKAVAFVRTTDEGKPVNLNEIDNDILFMEISKNPLEQLTVMMNNIFFGLIEQMGKTEWGDCDEEQKTEFKNLTIKFNEELTTGLKNLITTQNQCKVDKSKFEGPKTDQEKRKIAEEEYFNKWLDYFKEQMKEKDENKSSNSLEGPDKELEYWKNRLQKITMLHQLSKSPDFNYIKSIIVSNKPADLSMKKDENSNKLNTWKEIDTELTEQLNQAKDNVKYLSTLEKFIEPLQNGTPADIQESLPALMNAIKMIHTIARYYNTSKKLTNLFVKITNQMITNCKNFIQDSGKKEPGDKQSGEKQLVEIWDMEPSLLIEKLGACVTLCRNYKECYEKTRAKAAELPKSRHWDFDDNVIFGRFDTFIKRVKKLTEIFNTILQFKALEKHNKLDTMDELTSSFNKRIQEFREKSHVLLDADKVAFDKDYVELMQDIQKMDTKLQTFIHTHFGKIKNISYSLTLLNKFESILKRDNIKNVLANKYETILQNYGSEIEGIIKLFEERKSNPDVIRNMPSDAGKIIWVRHLYHRLRGPMDDFPQNLSQKDVMKKYTYKFNYFARNLLIYEIYFTQSWCNDIEKAKGALQNVLIVTKEENGHKRIRVNFENEIKKLIREAKALDREGIGGIPESAKIILLQEEKFKKYYYELDYIKTEYERILGKIKPIMRNILRIHILDLEVKLRPGMVTLTWTSMNIDGFLENVQLGLHKLEQLIITINDIIENRIENNLKQISKVLLVQLPEDGKPMSLEKFVDIQHSHIKDKTNLLISKNTEIERAVDDLIQTIMSYNFDQHIGQIESNATKNIKRYYFWYLYQALLTSTQNSLNAMKNRVCGKRGSNEKPLKPFFEVDVKLENGKVTLEPDLNKIQKHINVAATAVLKCSKQLVRWNEIDKNPAAEDPNSEKESLYEIIAQDKEIVKVILLLTGSIQGTRNEVKKFKKSFKEYGWLWKDNIKKKLEDFSKKNPQLQDYEEKLKTFSDVDLKIEEIEKSKEIGAMALKTDKLISGLKDRVKDWKDNFAEDLHQKAKSQLTSITENIKNFTQRLTKDVNNIDSLGYVMETLEEIKKEQAEIDLKFDPVLDMYNLLEIYLQGGITDKEEVENRGQLRKKWQDIIILAEEKQRILQKHQGEHLKSLRQHVRQFIIEVKEFRKNFVEKGPMVNGITPKEANERLNQFKKEFEIKHSYYVAYKRGEDLFGLQNQEYPEIKQTELEINNLDKLYSLYTNVLNTTTEWEEFPWSDVTSTNLRDWEDKVLIFADLCQKLPRDLREWEAYKTLRDKIDNYKKVLPLIRELKEPCVKDRHWEDLCTVTKKEFNYKQPDNFPFGKLLEGNLLENEEDVADILDAAKKQEKYEKQKTEIIDFWEDVTFDFKSMNRGAPCLLEGNKVESIKERLDEDIATLSGLSAMKQIGPFKEEVTKWQLDLTDVQNTLNQWVKIQLAWQRLESVFTSGDISKSMAAEANRFKKTDKLWMKTVMEKASETKKVVKCCQDDVIKSTLPFIQDDLDICQKQLDKYLEEKRKVFARFYFVSEDILLKFLSQGSEPEAVQEDFDKLYDAISRVEFEKIDKKSNDKSITVIRTLMGNEKEEVKLVTPVLCKANIENWLNELTKSQQATIKSHIKRAAQSLFISNMTFEQFVNSFIAQVTLLGMQMKWTRLIQDALNKNTQNERSKAANDVKAEISSYVATLGLLSKSDIKSPLERLKIETLMTVAVYLQEQTNNWKFKDHNDFEWNKLTRVYWKEPDTCQIEITDWVANYSYEYLGVKERLCITPLTDRCYITLAQAMSMYYGGAPAGPAGTGKTETVKDLGRTLGIFVVVTNCSPEHRYTDMAKIFKGLCQSGLWGCFDEFNRIDLEVLSVVAMQVEAITKAKKSFNCKQFDFPDEPNPINLVSSCGYFITMNPGYAGRQELPENLKALFRGVTMMVPDRRIIIKVRLASCGYKEFNYLSNKFYILYGLCEEQLSKQKHYDFGLRNILSVLRTAGNNLREEKDLDKCDEKARKAKEEMLMYRTLRDMNLSKLIADDVPLFKALQKDIFQGNDPAEKEWKEEEKKIKEKIIHNGLEWEKAWALKIIQVYETSLVRHGFMLVGPTGVGKTSILNVLAEAITDFKQKTTIQKLNPKSFTAQEMYGVRNYLGEWTTGIFSEIWRKANDKKPNKPVYWLVCDGPVDAIWIENLNTVLDDNKVLTLANGERIFMLDTCKLICEVENLNNASPATVSRCGQIYVSSEDLSMDTIIKSWVRQRNKSDNQSKTEVDKILSKEDAVIIYNIISKWFIQYKVIDFMEKITAKNPVMFLNSVLRLLFTLNLLNGVLTPSGAKSSTRSLSDLEMEKLFIFSMTWGAGGVLELKERSDFMEWLREKNAPLPKFKEGETLYDYVIDFELQQLDWKPIEPQAWKPPHGKFNFSQILMPTIDSYRAEILINFIAKQNKTPICTKSVLLLGASGTAKTSSILMYTNKFDKDKIILHRINFSSATEPHHFQASIDSVCEGKVGKGFGPKDNKKMAVFIDDFSMPSLNKWGDQITLEIVRQLMEDGGFYRLEKQERGNFKFIYNLQYLSAMNHPGGGRNDIPNRLKRQFFIFNMTLPSRVDIIYGPILKHHFRPKDIGDASRIVDLISAATVRLWNKVKNSLMPTPSKFHYVFNMRDLSRIFKGMTSIIMDVIKSSQKEVGLKPDLFIVALWKHECERVFADKLITYKDKDLIINYIMETAMDSFSGLENEIQEKLSKERPSYFLNFLKEDKMNEDGLVEEEAPRNYEACMSMEKIRSRCEVLLKWFNAFPKNANRKMDLVLFDDALKHLLRVSRILMMPRSSALLVGVGGSGKQSLTRAAAFANKQEIYQIVLNKNYNESSLKEDIKQIFDIAGHKGLPIVFILTDAEIKQESFLEYINMVLSTGEIPGLIPKDEKEIWMSDCRTEYLKLHKEVKEADNSIVYDFFLNRLRDNLHISLCFSPVGTKFRERARKFPALYNECSIDWFLPWPNEALVSVASQNVMNFEKLATTEDTKIEVTKHMAGVHLMVTAICDTYYNKMRRQVFVTPKSFLSFLKAFKKLYEVKYDELDKAEKNFNIGLAKIHQAKEDIEGLEKVLSKEQERLDEMSRKTQELLDNVMMKKKKAEEKNKEVTAKKNMLLKEKEAIDIEVAQCQAMLRDSEHLLKEAQATASKINQQDLASSRAPPEKAHIIQKYVIDIMNIIFYAKVNNELKNSIETRTVNGVKGTQCTFWADSYQQFWKVVFCDVNLLTNLKLMAQEETNTMNEEILELIEPYLKNNWMNNDNAKNASETIASLYRWADGMSNFTQETLKVIPKRQALKQKQLQLDRAMSELNINLKILADLEEECKLLDEQHKIKAHELNELTEIAKREKKRIDVANRLISSLSEERERWDKGAKELQSDKDRLVGNVSFATAFISYCGPFNAEFRKMLAVENFLADMKKKKIPHKASIFQELTSFLVDDAEISQWNLEGLPKDDLSVQNGIMVSTSDRFPLLIDPQGQGTYWIKNRFSSFITPPYSIVSISDDKRLKEGLNFCLENGRMFMIENIESEVDPLLDPVLEKQFTQRKVNGPKKIKIGGVDLDWDDKFKLFLTSKLSNPVFSPELCAKTTIIDFTVTQFGLEQQLLSVVLTKELRAVEEQLNQLMKEVTDNKKQLKILDDLLLNKLTTSSGNLIDDSELVEILNNTKVQSKDVQNKLKEADVKTKEINEKREQYRPVASRGAVLYFSIIEIANVNWMYNSSLNQFLDLYSSSIDKAKPATLPTKRVENIRKTLTERVFRYVNRGLFEIDKLTYLLMICFGILIKDEKLTTNDISLFLRCGSVIDTKGAKPKPNFPWMNDKEKMWANILALSQHKFGKESNDTVPFFKNLPDLFSANPEAWKTFIDLNNPEDVHVPEFQDKLSSNKEIGHFLKLCLIRALREDRTNIAAKAFIFVTLEDETFTKPYADTIESIWEETSPRVPVLYLLSAGADPTASIDELAKKNKRPVHKVSMGEGQERKAEALIKEGMEKGAWIMMQNCHLGLKFMAQLDNMLNEPDSMAKSDPEFRIWMSCEPRAGFPLGLLQKCLKVTNEPPKGIQAGIFKTFKTVVTPEYLEKIEHQHWRTLVYTVCFLHSLVIERRKFGALGFCVPYEFNNSDLEASLSFVEKYLNQIQQNSPTQINSTSFNVSYEVIIYMICEIQYGGRITDNLDRRLFKNYGELYFKESLTTPEFYFEKVSIDSAGGARELSSFTYSIPQGSEYKSFVDYINTLPAVDIPLVFGLNNNADMTFRLKETSELIETILNTRPKESGAGSGKTREEIVQEMANTYKNNLPPDYNFVEVRKSLVNLPGGRGYHQKGMEVPTNIFLFQELERMQRVLALVRKTLADIVDAVDGQIIMTPEIVEAIDSIFDGRVPKSWMYDTAGVEISWLINSFAAWFNSLILRNQQLYNWMKGERPKSFWLGGFFNPQGFLTAAKQEVARYTKAVKLQGKDKESKLNEWSLENVDYDTKVCDEKKQKDSETKSEYLFYINQLVLEGAKIEKETLKDIPEKDKTMITNIPLLEVTAKPKKDTKEDAVADKGQSKDYECPVYKYAKRTDKYFIFYVNLTMSTPGDSNKWIRRGVAILCSKDS